MPPESYPGAAVFIAQVAQEQGNPHLATQVGNLAPVFRSLDWIGLAANPRTDPTAAAALVKRVEGELLLLQMAATVIHRALDHLEDFKGVNNTLREHESRKVMLKPLQTSHPAQSGYPGIRTAPVDHGEFTETTSRARQALEMQEHYERVGVDEGMSGGPPRPDTGVNQSINQQNIPTERDKPPQSADTYKQSNNPPYEPSDTDHGGGALLGPEPGKGREASGMLGHLEAAEQSGQPLAGARGVAGPGEGSSGGPGEGAASEPTEAGEEAAAGPGAAAGEEAAAGPGAAAGETPERPERRGRRR